MVKGDLPMQKTSSQKKQFENQNRSNDLAANARLFAALNSELGKNDGGYYKSNNNNKPLDGDMGFVFQNAMSH